MLVAVNGDRCAEASGNGIEDHEAVVVIPARCPAPIRGPNVRQVGAGGRVAKTLFTFTASNPLLNMRNEPRTGHDIGPWRREGSVALADHPN